MYVPPLCRACTHWVTHPPICTFSSPSKSNSNPTHTRTRKCIHVSKQSYKIQLSPNFIENNLEVVRAQIPYNNENDSFPLLNDISNMFFPLLSLYRLCFTMCSSQRTSMDDKNIVLNRASGYHFDFTSTRIATLIR